VLLYVYGINIISYSGNKY